MHPKAKPKPPTQASFRSATCRKRPQLRHPHNKGLARPRCAVTIEESHLSFEGYDIKSGINATTFAPPTAQESTLGHRFHSLPAEIRAEIFSHLLVRTVKWNVSHEESCKNLSIGYSPSCHLPGLDSTKNSCAHCTHGANSVSQWRNSQAYIESQRQADNARSLHRHRRSLYPVRYRSEIWVDPSRSEWAPPQRNPYLCTNCYEERVRPRPCPRPYAVFGAIPCLCARRRNLQVMLVSRQWYDEAATVLYSRNTFSFEDKKSFIDFVATLQPRWADKISKVSILSPLLIAPPYNPPPSDPQSVPRGGLDLDEFESPITSTVMKLLRQLPGLTTIELPSLCLTNQKALRNLRRLGHSNIQQVNFVDAAFLFNEQEWWGRNFAAPNKHVKYVWPHLAVRKLVIGGTAELIARAVKAQPVMRGVNGRRGQHFWETLAKEERKEYLDRRKLRWEQ
ncbi:hypothetical protein K431DRAFT_350313 [Polychaeton citri CBS 116435]|uniref:DUF7730 domain-containing protein n=1 Tax=Polychaeton citri CBS 116435 TaxID=1314669 RepID=A0A9P4PZ28_9PEZI|nr:hypothetical protein K431DRAFT_350313 [Polychaeton citri CBS 116435]